MDAQALERRVAELLAGRLAPAPTWEVAEVAQLIADEIGRPDSATTAAAVRQAVGALNGHRHFEHTRLVGQAWQGTRGFDATIQRHVGQALIELSALDDAEQLLRAGLAQIRSASNEPVSVREVTQYEGLLARIAKQRFVSEGDPGRLQQAIDAYLTTYRTHPGQPYWHGINAVALLARQARDSEGTVADAAERAATIAAELRTRLRAAWAYDASDHWLASTLSEASLALGDCDEAELWLYRFLHHPGASPFAVDSYDRQLREIWQGSTVGPGPACPTRLTGIVAAHLLRTQARLTVSGDQLRTMTRALAAEPSYLERNFSGERGISLELLRRMMASCASIGCVTSKRGERLGTGFLVQGDALQPTWGTQPVFVTNAHVIGTEVKNALAPGDALVTFEVVSDTAGAPVFHRVAEMLYSSPPGELGVRSQPLENLDVTVVRLDLPGDALKGLGCAAQLPLVDAKAKAYVVGHPQGAGLQLSLHDSVLLDIDDDERLVHYRTPTDPGSSGSPVFGATWNVIALHHGGSSTMPRFRGAGSYEANEGISIVAIRRRLAL